MDQIDKIVLITKKTPEEELVHRFMSRRQAQFYLEQGGESFAAIEEFQGKYTAALETIRNSAPKGVEVQEVDREFLPNFVFGPGDVVATLGPDGLVVNAAKYVRDQPIIAFNPDPQHFDGVLAPFYAIEAKSLWKLVTSNRLRTRNLVMAQATLNDGQTLLGVNDLFIGQRTHVSARYVIRFGKREEQHSSSGVIVSTGAGSTGWYRSVVTGAVRISSSLSDAEAHNPEYAWPPELPELRFSVREPFESRASQAGLCSGKITPDHPLTISSRMPQNGVIFSDGVEEDFLTFNSGSTAQIAIADRRVRLAARS